MNKPTSTLKELIGSNDPLSDEALRVVLGSHEENSHVDYKLTFKDSDESWLEMTKDIIAFANTDGGYLAFGVKNGTFDILGLDEDAVRLLGDTNNLMLKLNRFVEPEFTALRSKAFEDGGKKCVIVFIPPSLGHTHVISKDGSFKQLSGTPKLVLRQGTIYVRRSGANHLANARDVDAIVARRMEYFRSSLLEKIARVVESPPETEVLVVTRTAEEDGQKKFVIENSSDAVAVKGLSFTVSPETTEQEIAAWIAITAKTPGDLPSSATVWKWYRERKQLQLTPAQKVHVAAFSLLQGAPYFYWLQDCPADQIRAMLLELLGRKIDPEIAGNILLVAAFLGKRFHKSAVSELGPMANRLNKRELEFPASGPRSLFDTGFASRNSRVGKQPPNAGAETELDEIAASSLTSGDGEPELRDRWRAERLDGYLYSPANAYAPSSPKPESDPA